MDINTIFLVGLALVEFGIIVYLLFKVDNFQRKVKGFLKENLSKDEKILKIKSILIKKGIPEEVIEEHLTEVQREDFQSKGKDVSINPENQSKEQMEEILNE